MDITRGAVSFVSDEVADLRDGITGAFDLEKENINGIFTNMTLLSMLLMTLTRNRKLLKGKQTFKDEYDYVIVGGGTAGSVMANRLSEKPCVSVLLLEAGGEPPLLTEIPAAARLFFNTGIDWSYRTTPQRYAAFANKNNQVIIQSGKVLGGSSTLNAMLYVRGNMRNFDQWAAEGATGWSYEEVLPYFLKLEDNRNIEELEPEFHVEGGPMTAEKINYVPEIKNPVLEATASMGYEERDINGRRQTGVYDLQATVRNQQRCSTAKAYLEPAQDRENLDIVTNAFVRKILIDQRGGVNRAYGVQLDYSGERWTVRARREVIIANGAIRTPQLLMLSGIGPREHLDQLNIPVVADLPVGKNLQDHPSSNLVYSISETITPLARKLVNAPNFLDYLINRRGPFCAPFQCSILAFLDGLNTTRNSRDFPRQEIYFAEYDVLDERFKNIRDDVYDRVYKPYEGKPLYICYSSALQPRSRGEVTLNSTNPYDYPNIDFRYHEDQRDLQDVAEGLKICDAVAKQPAMRQVDAKLIDTMRSGFPNCQGLEGDEDQYFRCIARQLVNTFWHPVGTARMGSRHDPRSVVDPELRVIGVNNLRVINGAIMPIITSGNPNVPIMMIAEKAYDMMKDDIQCHDNHFARWRHRHFDLIDFDW